MSKQILIVDDDEKIAKLLEIYLVNEGFDIFKADNGITALELVDEHPIDLIILDIMIPKMDGIAVCMKIRESRTTPILMLSARDGDMDKITGLMTGADDYMVKPFNPLELIARVKSLLRRSSYAIQNNPVPTDNMIKCGSLLIDKETHTAMVDGRHVKLTPIEFSILFLLASYPGRVFGSEEIFELIWRDKFIDSSNSVTVHISRLRDKLEKEMAGEKLIHTVWGVGYKIEG